MTPGNRLPVSGISRIGPTLPLILLTLALSYYFGAHPYSRYPMLLVAGAGALALLRYPALGVGGLILAALLLPVQFGTGTDVTLNPAALLVPALLLLWLLEMTRRRELSLRPSRVNLPLFLFLLAGLLSLAIGNITWDPAIPRSDRFTLVQLAQWAIFVFSAGALWLAGNLIRDERALRRFTFFYLALAGALAILRVLPIAGALVQRFGTGAVDRAPFWMLLTAAAGGQLFFNQSLSGRWRAFLGLTLAAALFFSFIAEREAASYWVGVGAVIGALVWLRLPHLRALIVAAVVALGAIGLLFPSLYNFAGGDVEWDTSGGSRLALIGRVVEVTMRNPITGLGPASYRPYANATPFKYLGALWWNPQINSHNNFVDLFAHGGVLGLALFFWFMAELGWVGWRLRRFRDGFAAGYANGMLAACAGALAIMMLADWMLPFIYNIGFHGYQASVLVWLFWGGLIVLDRMPGEEASA
jgi:hypothetical protein